MKKHLLFLFAFTLMYATQAQQTKNFVNNWHFGNNLGITFNSGSPVNIQSAISTDEVSASQSDGNGNTLFYIGSYNPNTSNDTKIIYDASDNPMPNSDIQFYYSSACGLAVAPVPNSCSSYYVFHMIPNGSYYGLAYSVIDMTLPGNGTSTQPLGDVPNGQKNITHYTGDFLAEKIKIIQKGNSENYWVLVRSVQTDKFYAFEVSASGVSPFAVESVVSNDTFNIVNNIAPPMLGWLAVNKDRNLIAEPNRIVVPNKMSLYQFNNLTGQLSIAETLYHGIDVHDIIYGLEFSPNGKVLYMNWTSTFNDPLGVNMISYFNIDAGTGNIAGTRQDVVTNSGVGGEYGAILKAPDGKLYAAQQTSNSYLTVVNTPNDYNNPNIIFNGHSLGIRNCNIGLPNITYYFHPDNFIDSLAGPDQAIPLNSTATIGEFTHDSIWCTYQWSPANLVLNPNNKTTETVPLINDQTFFLHTITSCGDTIKTDTVMVTIQPLILPIELNSFQAEKLNQRSTLCRWTTKEEKNIAFFEIERSRDGIEFISIQTHFASNNNLSTNYQIRDLSPFSGINYYRLKTVSNDGDIHYSAIRSVVFENNPGAMIYPNPFDDLIHVELESAHETDISIEIYNALGQIVFSRPYSLSFGINAINIEVSHLASGTYHIKVINGIDEALLKKMVKS